MKKTKDRVEQILHDYPETRNSDRKLYITYLAEFHSLYQYANNGGFEGVKKVFLNPETPPMETISRARRKIQAEGKYEASEDVKRERHKASEQFGEYYARGSTTKARRV